jgi:hypothetical protein
MHVAEKLPLMEKIFSRATDDKVPIKVVSFRSFHSPLATVDNVRL